MEKFNMYRRNLTCACDRSKTIGSCKGSSILHELNRRLLNYCGVFQTCTLAIRNATGLAKEAQGRGSVVNLYAGSSAAIRFVHLQEYAGNKLQKESESWV